MKNTTVYFVYLIFFGTEYTLHEIIETHKDIYTPAKMKCLKLQVYEKNSVFFHEHSCPSKLQAGQGHTIHVL